MSISTISRFDEPPDVKCIPDLLCFKQEALNDQNSQDNSSQVSCYSSYSSQKDPPDTTVKKEYDYLNSDNVLFLPNDLVISKAGSPSVNEEQRDQEHNVSYEKIDFNCDVIRDHSRGCDCSTPRLHIYLLNGHQCNCLCSRKVKINDEDTMEADELKIEIDDQSDEDISLNDQPDEDITLNDHPDEGMSLNDQPDEDISLNDQLGEGISLDGHPDQDKSLDSHPDEDISLGGHPEEDISLDYSSSSQEQLMINETESNDKSSEFETQNINIEEVNKISLKTLENIKKENDPEKNENNNKRFQFTNIFDDHDNATESSSFTENESGIPAKDFHEELMHVVTSISKEKCIDKKSICQQPFIPFVESFAGLLKEEPRNLVNDEKITKIYEKESKKAFNPDPTSLEETLNPTEEYDSIAAINNFLADRASSTSEENFCKTKHLNNFKKYRKRNKQTVEVAGISFIAPLRLKFLLNSPKAHYLEPDNSEKSAIDPVIPSIKTEPNLENNNLTETENNSSILNSKDINVKNLIKSCSTSTLVNVSELDKWDCSLCFTTYPSFTELVDHLENHQTDGYILCYYCQKSFGDKTSMKRHMRTHTGERPYQCKICSKRFSLPGNFKKHRDIHEDIRTEPCSVCGKTFRRKEHLKYHMRTHTGEKPFHCSLCGSSFTARYSLQIHMNIHLGRKPYICNYCSKGFSDKSTMRKHIRVHTGERPFNCKECHKSFGESGTLAAHLATHRKDRPFLCKLCQLTFKTSGGLRQHDKIHKGDKQFSCKYCGMRFIQKYNMVMHERIHTGEKPYECSECGRTFRSRSCLGKHIVLHAGDEERKYNCTHCDKKFFRKAHLKRHVDMHLGIKEHECHICYKRFCTKVTLRNHSKTFHVDGSRVFPCKLCGKVFKRNIYVTTHKCTKSKLKQEADDDSNED